MNEQEMMRKHQKRKDRIKNIAILFLTVMLLLTFFSNTIMNYSLAEVGSAYATSGTLTTKIRGDGFVEAKDPVQVKTDKTSEVLKVYVKNGDKVKKGQTMFVLEGSTVSELKQAQADLMTLQYEYEKALLEMQVPDYGKNNLDIKYAKKDLEDALQNITDTKKEEKEKEADYKKLKEKASAAKEKMDVAADKVEEKSKELLENTSQVAEATLEVNEYTAEKESLEAKTNEDVKAKKAAEKAAKRVTEDAETAYNDALEVQKKYESTSERDFTSEIKQKKKAITALEEELEELKTKVSELQNYKVEEDTQYTEILSNMQTILNDIDRLNTIENINKEIVKLQEKISSEKDEKKKAEYEQKLAELNAELTTIQASIVNKEESASNLRKKYNELQTELAKKNTELNNTNTKALTKAKKEVSEKETEIAEEKQELVKLQDEKAQAETNAANLAAATVKAEECQKVLKEAQAAQKAAERAREDAEDSLQKEKEAEKELLEGKIKEGNKKLNELNSQKEKLTAQKEKLDAVYAKKQAAYETAKAAVDSFQKADENAMDTVNQAADEKRKALESLYLDLATAKTDNYLKQQLADLDSSQKKKQIEQKKKEIAKLRKKKKPVRIKAKQAGIVGNVSLKVGDTTVPETALAEIQLKKNGFQLSIPVTIEQSKQVKRGDHATILNIWDDDVKAVLSEIKTDAQNPNAGRTLVFDVSGNVENGTSLSIAVGERTANYDLIVPTSAIREDSNGKFVLIIEEKSSPVGNRYIARKEEISVITQDETQSAITGGFDSYTSIITTSSKSVEPGDYVRLSA